jgi:CRP-like cAMP-binding protein
MALELIEPAVRTAPSQRFGRSQLLLTLPPRDLALLLPELTEVQLARGTVIHERGDAIEHVYFIHDGLVSLLVGVAETKSVEIATIGREGAVGALAGLGSGIALNHAVVQLPVRAARIATGRLAAIARDSRAVRDMLLACGNLLLIQVQQLAACNATHDVQERLSRWLLQVADRHGTILPLTQELMARLLGVQRTTVTMVCRTLQVDGLIHVGRGMVRILDASGLEKKACPCYRVMRHATRETIDKVASD